MARKPVSLQNGLDTRQAVWSAIRKLGTFTVRQVRDETMMHMDSVRDYLTGLWAAGYITKQRTTVGPAVYELAKDVGIEAPRVRKDGTPVTAGQGRENMWNAMRILKTFTAVELAVAARTPSCFVAETTAVDYIKHLALAGYLINKGKGVYQMLPSAYTGPFAPMVQRVKRVWDQNQRQVRWQEGGASDDE